MTTRRSAKKSDDATIKLEKTYVKEKERYAQGKVDKSRTAAEHQKSKLVQETVHEFTRINGTNKGKIKAKNQEDRIEKWKDHFQNLLVQPPVITSKLRRTVFQHALPINIDDFTMEELKKCIKSFKINKAPELDNIPFEVWKTGVLNVQFLEVCNKTLKGDRMKI